MPIYEYTCRNCGAHFEKLMRSGDTASCESCGSEKVEKHFSVFAVVDGGKRERPACSSGCSAGFEAGRCGSGMCCGTKQ